MYIEWISRAGKSFEWISQSVKGYFALITQRHNRRSNEPNKPKNCVSEWLKHVHTSLRFITQASTYTCRQQEQVTNSAGQAGVDGRGLSVNWYPIECGVFWMGKPKRETTLYWKLSMRSNELWLLLSGHIQKHNSLLRVSSPINFFQMLKVCVDVTSWFCRQTSVDIFGHELGLLWRRSALSNQHMYHLAMPIQLF